jgi:hypothetical protein
VFSHNPPQRSAVVHTIRVLFEHLYTDKVSRRPEVFWRIFAA